MQQLLVILTIVLALVTGLPDCPYPIVPYHGVNITKREEAIACAFPMVDANGDGAIDKEEYDAFTKGQPAPPFVLMKWRCDCDGNGIVEAEEARRATKTCLAHGFLVDLAHSWTCGGERARYEKADGTE
jgi:hypothetical protein